VRLTPKLQHTAAFDMQPSSAAVMVSSFSPVIARGRPADAAAPLGGGQAGDDALLNQSALVLRERADYMETQCERLCQARAVILRTASAILEQMPGINAGCEQRIALQVRALPVGVRRHAHVTNQHRRITINNRFSHGSVCRQSFPHISR